MEKIMILGAGPAQVPLIREARSMGLQTVVATIPGDYPGIPEADAVTYTDITDAPAIAAEAARYAVSGVATCCFELGLRAQALACDKLGLPGISPAAAEISANKLAMKEAFDAGGVLTAPWRRLDSENDVPAAAAALGFPMVVKAVDLQGSRGVYVVRDTDQARRAFRQALALSGERCCLAEAFLTGSNCGAEAFVQGGKPLLVMPDGTLSACQPGGPNVPIGHYVPLEGGEAVRAAVTEQVHRAIRACGLDDCAVNFDFVLHDGRPYVIELTARAGATCLPELTGLHYGINYYRMILLAALGRDAGAYLAGGGDPRRACAAVMLRSPRDGTVRAIHLPEKLPASVYQLSLIVKPGDRVRAFTQTADRIGQAIVTGPDADGCRRELDRLLEQIKIEVE